jgi:hypothetical protein
VTLRRYSSMKPSRGTTWPREVRELIVERDDGHCVCVAAGFPAEVIAKCPVYPVELDHVRASHGIQMKSRSTLDNGVCLSNPCHRWKTEHGKEARPLLLDYIAGRVDCGHVEPVHGCSVCLRRTDSMQLEETA